MSRIINPDVFPVTYRPSATDVSGAFFVADAPYVVVSIKESHRVVSLSGTLNVEKLTGTAVPGSGASLLSSNISLTGTVNAVTAGSLTSTTSDLYLAVGDRLGGVLGGVLTGLSGCVVTVALRRLS